MIPETRPVYGGSNSEDSSGVLRYVRVEFAGVNFNPETQPNAFGFHGVGSGTIIDHIQAHEGENHISRNAISSRTREAILRPCWRAGRNRHCRTESTAFLSSPRPRCRRTTMFLA